MAQKKITGTQVDILLDDLQDVDVGAADPGDVLTYDGSDWVSQPQPELYVTVHPAGDGDGGNVLVGDDVSPDITGSPSTRDNTIVGSIAARVLGSTGNARGNVLIGMNVGGLDLTQGSNNIIIGPSAGRFEAGGNAGQLDNAFIINNQDIRAPGTFPPYIAGSMTGGASDFNLAADFYVLNNSGTEAFAALQNGSLLIGGLFGTPGQVLTSNGIGASASWETPSGGGGAEPANQLVFGTGTGTDSSADFTFNPVTGGLELNQSNGSYPNPGDLFLQAPFSDGSGPLNGANVYIFAGGPGGDGGTGGEVIIRSGSNNQQTNSRSEILLSTAPGDNQASDMYFEAGQGADGNNGGNISMYAGNTSAGGNGGTLNIGAGNTSGGTSVFAGEVYISAGAVAGTGVEGTGGSAYFQAGTVQAQNLGDYTDAQAGSAHVDGGRLIGATNYTGVARAGDVFLNAGYADDGDQVKGGSIRFRVNNGAVEHSFNPYGALLLDDDTGTAGQVLTSNGPTAPPYWAAGGGGGYKTQAYFLSSTTNSWQFSGTTNGTWNISATHAPPPAQFVQVSGFYSDEFEFLENGTYRLTLVVNLVPAAAPLPTDLSAYGLELINSGGSFFSQNPTYHHVYGTNAYPTGHFGSLSFGSSPGGQAGGNLTWTDTFIFTGSAGHTIKPYIYAYNYSNDTFQYGASIALIIDKISDDNGS